VGILQPYLLYKIGEKYAGKTTGLVAAAVTAIYFYFVYYSAALMTEPFYITAILAVLYLAMLITDASRDGLLSQRIWLAAAIGLALGCAILLRQLFLLITPFFLAWIGWRVFRQKRRLPLIEIILPLVIIALMIVPFTIFNYQRFDQFVLLNTNAGFAFFWGNHPIYGTQFIPILPKEMGTYFDLIPKELLPLSEPALDQALMKLGIGFILDDPVRYILLSISRIPAYFQFWPSGDSNLFSNIARVGSFGIFWPFMLYGLIRRLAGGDIWRFSSFTWLVLLFTLTYTGMHLLTWALIRYRLPVDAIMLLFSSIGLMDLYAWLAKTPIIRSASVVKP
jgi:4-amino-4-deoxy-L-arabinose transferase-like glycosyltransferase